MPASLLQLAALHAVVPSAQLSMQQYGVPASVTLAQWVIESGWGSTGLAKKCRNYFGIKHVHANLGEPYREFRTEEDNGGKHFVQAEFVAYVTDDACFRAHARLLALSSRYAPAMRDRRDVPEFCSQLQLCGYSTNHDYAKDLLAIIRQYNLTQYDTLPPSAVAQEIAA